MCIFAKRLIQQLVIIKSEKENYKIHYCLYGTKKDTR